MRIEVSVRENENDTCYIEELNEYNEFPVLFIGIDSYISSGHIQAELDDNLIYNIQIGRYTSIGDSFRAVICYNHPFKRVFAGKIGGIEYRKPKITTKYGQIIIMNDCLIGENVTVTGGVTIHNGAVVMADSVVTKDVPAYAIVEGNPARIIGYRFTESQIRDFEMIRWWNWDKEKILAHAEEMTGDVEDFLCNNIEEAKKEYNCIEETDIHIIPKVGQEGKVIFYVPDFGQKYPTYQRVIEEFISSYADTNNELLLYIKEDGNLDEKLAMLDLIFERYEEVNCYINLFIGNVNDIRSIMKQVDAYVTNRSVENITYMDAAELYGVEIISGVDLPVFGELENINIFDNEIVSNEENTSVLLKNIVRTLGSQNQNIQMLTESLGIAHSHIEQLSNNQVGINNAINNIKYEILDNTDVQYPIVESGDKAVEKIINEKKSICRFGDGEFSLIFGYDRHRFQNANEALAMRLTEVLKSYRDDVLVCIADNYGDLSRYDEASKFSIRDYLSEEIRKQHYSILDMSRTYYDAYLSRPYILYADKNTDAPYKRFERIKEIWQGKELLIIEGEKTRMGVGNNLFNNAKSIIRILGPSENAFDRYDDLLSEALKQDRNKIVLIAMGATATVLAYDLAVAGFQALDIGHIDLEYEWLLEGKGRRTSVKNKYNNEVEGGNIVEDICDSTYERQIIARIY